MPNVGAFDGPHELAASGSTGNATHTSKQAGRAATSVVFVFEITAVGATPTVTYKYQGSVDNTNWYDILYITDASDTAAATAFTKTAVGQYICFLSNPGVRNYKYFRLVTSANTNVTYKSDLYLIG
jgi:hypothetical protein